jgi:hypothetical protein
MADLEFSRDDIVSLIEKVSTLQPSFSTQELQLLMAVFELAGEHTAPVDGPRETPERPDPATVDELKEQLLQAYTPTPDSGSFHSAAGSGIDAATIFHIHLPGSIHR